MESRVRGTRSTGVYGADAAINRATRGGLVEVILDATVTVQELMGKGCRETNLMWGWLKGCLKTVHDAELILRTTWPGLHLRSQGGMKPCALHPVVLQRLIKIFRVYINSLFHQTCINCPPCWIPCARYPGCRALSARVLHAAQDAWNLSRDACAWNRNPNTNVKCKIKLCMWVMRIQRASARPGLTEGYLTRIEQTFSDGSLSPS